MDLAFKVSLQPWPASLAFPCAGFRCSQPTEAKGWRSARGIRPLHHTHFKAGRSENNGNVHVFHICASTFQHCGESLQTKDRRDSWQKRRHRQPSLDWKCRPCGVEKFPGNGAPSPSPPSPPPGPCSKGSKTLLSLLPYKRQFETPFLDISRCRRDCTGHTLHLMPC